MRHLGTALVLGIPFGLGMSLLFVLITGGWRGIVPGAVAGVLFGAICAAFAAAVQARGASKDGTFAGEPVLHEGPANHWSGEEARGGWLVLTPSRLVFRAHGYNFQKHPVVIARGEIVGVEPGRSLGIIPNGLRVRRLHGGEERFVVRAQSAWVRALRT